VRRSRRHALLTVLAPLITPCALAVGLGCGAGPTTTVGSVLRIAGNGQTGVAGVMLTTDLVVEVHGDRGEPAPGREVRFQIVSGGGATSDTTVTSGAGGRASTTWYLGPTADVANVLRVIAGEASVEYTATSRAPVPGATYYGRNQYMEYDGGDLPILITAPHGGSLTPAELPDRSGADITTATDLQTEQLAHDVSAALVALTGKQPHVIICRLKRTKIDANREIVEAAEGNRLAQRAWFEFHSFAEAARRAVTGRYGTGFYIDLHGHGHDIQRLELGYLLTSTDLGLSDAMLDQPAYRTKSSLRAVSLAAGETYSMLVRGSSSLGALLTAQGFPAVPSPAQPAPGVDPYFNGGYNTARYGSSGGGTMSGLQIESNFTGVRDTQANRQRFAQALASALDTFFAAHLGIDITP
jgi:hypothetical protein